MNSTAAQIIENDDVNPSEIDFTTPRVSDALRAVAGDFVWDLARLDPFPHLKILSKPRAIIHLTGIVLSKRNSKPCHAFMVLAEHDVASAIEIAFGKSVEGLPGILKKCPVTMFSRETYQRFATLVFEHRAVKVMGHSPLVDQSLIDTLYYLPEELRHSAIIKNIISPNEARILELASSPDDGPVGTRIRCQFAARLCDCKSRKTLWNVIREELFERFVILPKVPAIDDSRIKCLSTVREINQAADDFGNCLRMMVGGIVDEAELALYRYDDESGQKAVISVKPVFREIGIVGEIDSIKGEKNAELPEMLVKEIAEIFARSGIILRMADQGTQFGRMSRVISDIKRCESKIEIDRALRALEDAIFAST